MEPRLLTIPLLRPRAEPVPAISSANVQEALGVAQLDKAQLDKLLPRRARHWRTWVWRALDWRTVALAAQAGACALMLDASPAQAQAGPRAPESLNGDGADTHLFRPAVDSKGFFSVN